MSTDHNALGYRYPELLPGCTGCRACFDVCPDFVFEVYKFDEPIDESAGLVITWPQRTSQGVAS
jgi:ferredoxin